MAHVVNWEKHQHYKTRRPPWIKLHTDVFQNYDFSRLQDASKLLAFAIWTVASKSVSGEFPYDIDYIKSVCSISSVTEENLQELVNAGFIVASNALAKSSSETEAERETETYKNAPYPVAFEDFWKASWKHGSKGDAFKAWKQNGSPTSEESAPAIVAYLAAKKTSGQALANVGVWLRAGGAKQTEWHLAPIGTSNFKPALARAVPAPYHAPAKPAEADWSKLAPWPKEKT